MVKRETVQLLSGRTKTLLFISFANEQRCLPWPLINNTNSIPSSYVAHMTPLRGRQDMDLRYFFDYLC